MSLYARSDVMSVAVPATSGGCGHQHTRPVVKGAPVKLWKLDCAHCESFLRGDGRTKKIHVTPGDKDNGIAPKMKKVADADPMWSSTPRSIPLTPDEEEGERWSRVRARDEISALNAFAAAKMSGLPVSPELQFYLEGLSGTAAQAVQGSVVCLNNHDNPAGTKFCSECGVSMSAKAVIEPSPQVVDLEDVMPLESLHIATLKKRARELGLSDAGNKGDLITRIKGTTT